MVRGGGAECDGWGWKRDCWAIISPLHSATNLSGVSLPKLAAATAGGGRTSSREWRSCGGCCFSKCNLDRGRLRLRFRSRFSPEADISRNRIPARVFCARKLGFLREKKLPAGVLECKTAGAEAVSSNWMGPARLLPFFHFHFCTICGPKSGLSKFLFFLPN